MLLTAVVDLVALGAGQGSLLVAVVAQTVLPVEGTTWIYWIYRNKLLLKTFKPHTRVVGLFIRVVILVVMGKLTSQCHTTIESYEPRKNRPYLPFSIHSCFEQINT